ncbi:hypothetical protein AMTRI_Chr03g48390 [Amborella trichopoda]
MRVKIGDKEGYCCTQCMSELSADDDDLRVRPCDSNVYSNLLMKEIHARCASIACRIKLVFFFSLI